MVREINAWADITYGRKIYAEPFLPAKSVPHLEKSFLQRRIEPIAFRYPFSPLEKAPRGEASSDPFNGHHIAFLRDKTFWSRPFDVSSWNPSGIQDLEDFAVGGVWNFSFSLQVVGLNAISSGYSVLVFEKTVVNIVNELVNNLCLALYDLFADFVSVYNWTISRQVSVIGSCLFLRKI